MNHNRSIIIGIAMVMVLSSMLIAPATAEEDSRQYMTHAPIVITGDTGWTAANGVSGGTGAPHDPFTIESFEIDAGSGSGITITGTNKYFEIQYCKISGASGTNAGIILTNANNGYIDHNEISGNAIGIKISTSQGHDISHNTFSGNAQAILADNVESSEFDYNTLTGYTNGITLNGGTAADNTDNDVDYNNFAGGDLGVHINKGTNIDVDYNTFSDVKTAFQANDVTNIAFDYNNFWGGTKGANLNAATATDGDYNEYKDYTSHALTLVGVTSSSFTENNFINNNPSGKQASATGVTDIDIDNNYWDDWTSPDADTDGYVDVPYDLDGGEINDTEPYAAPIPGVGYDVPPALSVTVTTDKTSGMVPFTVAFTSTVTGGVAPYAYLWDFGDAGGNSILASDSHTYSVGGTYTARVVVSDALGQVAASAPTTIETYDQLYVEIAADKTEGDYPLKVTFTSTVKFGKAPYTYSWDFGDGKTSTEAQPEHTYATNGTFAVILTVTDDMGNTETSTIGTPQLDITVTSPIPPLEVTATSSKLTGRAPLKVDFKSTVKGGQGPYTYKWSHQSGDIGTQGNVTHKFGSAGTYIVTLEVTDSLGTKETKTLSVLVLPKKVTDTPGFEAGIFVLAIALVLLVIRRKK